MQEYFSFLGYCVIVAVLLSILWWWVFAPYKKYREEQLIKFTAAMDVQTQEEIELIEEKI